MNRPIRVYQICGLYLYDAGLTRMGGEEDMAMEGKMNLEELVVENLHDLPADKQPTRGWWHWRG